MHITMVKKRLLNGEACKKCGQAEELLRSRGLWGRVDEVVWADEADAESPGMQLGRAHHVELAPFFVVRGDDGTEAVYTSTIQFIKGALLPNDVAVGAAPADASATSLPSAEQIAGLASEFEIAGPERAVRWALERFGASAAIAFSGAEDVALIDMAAKTGLPFAVFSLDTGRLHAETYRFIEKVRAHYGIAIEVMFPDAALVQGLVEKKGLFSFYNDGHSECCGIRKVEPLGRALKKYRAWITGQRRDQSPTRSAVNSIELDLGHEGATGPLLKLNPLAAQSLAQVWNYIREHAAPYNELHDRGFISIGCEPCTRAIRPGEHERAGRWWWEESTQRECGLHVPK